MITTKVSGFAGQVSKTGLLDTINKPVAEAIPFGRFTAGTTNFKARLPMTNSLVILFSANSTAGDVFNMDVNGVAISPVTYATSNNLTIDAVAAQIQATGTGLTATRTATNQITVLATTGTALSVDNIVVAGGSAPTATKTYTSTDGTTNVLGISQMEQKEQNSSGIAQYELLDIAQIVTKGKVLVHCEDAFDENSNIFIRVVEESGTYQKRGMIRTDAGSPVIAVAFAKGKIRNSGSAGELAEIDILLP